MPSRIMFAAGCEITLYFSAACSPFETLCILIWIFSLIQSISNNCCYSKLLSSGIFVRFLALARSRFVGFWHPPPSPIFRTLLPTCLLSGSSTNPPRCAEHIFLHTTLTFQSACRSCGLQQWYISLYDLSAAISGVYIVDLLMHKPGTIHPFSGCWLIYINHIPHTLCILKLLTHNKLWHFKNKQCWVLSSLQKPLSTSKYDIAEIRLTSFAFVLSA